MEKLVDEFNWVLRLLGDGIDNLESVQAIYANPSIETTLSDLRYARDRVAKLIEYFARLDEAT
jgi:hypothetical protein